MSSSLIDTESNAYWKQKNKEIQETYPLHYKWYVAMPVRLVILILTVIVVKVTEKHLPEVKNNSECIIDYNHKLVSPWNQTLSQNKTMALILQGFYSVLIDLSFVCYLIYWVKYERSMRLIISLILMYLFKIMYDASFYELAPQNMVWITGGMPSLLITSAKNYNFTCALVPGLYTIFTIEAWVNFKSKLISMSFVF